MQDEPAERLQAEQIGIGAELAQQPSRFVGTRRARTRTPRLLIFTSIEWISLDEAAGQ